jgi:hypothetical protein
MGITARVRGRKRPRCNNLNSKSYRRSWAELGERNQVCCLRTGFRFFLHRAADDRHQRHLANLDLPNASQRLGKLVDSIFVGAPNALIALAKITPSQKEPANTNTTTYNAALPAMIQSRTARGKHIALVDMNAPFLANDSWKKTFMPIRFTRTTPVTPSWARLGTSHYGTSCIERR